MSIMTLVIKVRLSQFLCLFLLLLFKGIKPLKILLFLPTAINWKGIIRKFFSSTLIYITAWRTLLVYTAKNLTSFGSYELIKTQIASIFGKKLKFINSFSLNIFFLAVRPK